MIYIKYFNQIKLLVLKQLNMKVSNNNKTIFQGT